MLRRLACVALLFAAAPALAADDDDPYLWLEEVQGARALAQVDAWNRATEQDLSQTPDFEANRARALSILNDPRQIALPDQIQGNVVTNFWRDAEHPRGLWRTSPLRAYLAGRPEWRTLIDVDALGRQENKSWVWHGADCLAPTYRRCLVQLSPGGGDADVVREFDTSTGAFVADGFVLPEAKSNVTWLDADRLMVVTDFGPDSLTTSGYGRIAKIWRRGTPLSAAQTIAEADPTDVSLSPFGLTDGNRRWNFISRSVIAWVTRVSLVTESGVIAMPIPETASVLDVLDGRLIVRLNRPLESGGRELPVGSLVAYDLRAIAAQRETAPELVMAPSSRQAIEEVATSQHVLWVKALEDVSGRLFALRRGGNGRWSAAPAELPLNSTVHIVAAGRDRALVTVEGMLTPPSLHAVTTSRRVSLVQSLPPVFDASQFEVEQRFATSNDGTRIPYFLVRKRGTQGAVPTFIHAYGGFRNAQTPTYLTEQPYRSGPLGLFWVEAGNAYVLANIRGGGEYGPAWHEAVLRENRQKSFDDLHAVAEDLIRTGVTSRGHLGISGRSNGGILVGAAANQRPDLYSAVISGSPLADMRRYSHLLAGASWIGEYGDPDVPADWAFMRLYSPYQNLRAVPNYPATFYYSSTMDDRVHPGHARKMAARHAALGQRFYFREYREGGHSVGADRSEDATRAALLYAFLSRELGAAQ